MSKKRWYALVIIIVLICFVFFVDDYIKVKEQYRSDMSGERVARLYQAEVVESYKQNDNTVIKVIYQSKEYTLIIDDDTVIVNHKQEIIENKVGYQVDAYCFFSLDQGDIDDGWGSTVFPVDYLKWKSAWGWHFLTAKLVLIIAHYYFNFSIFEIDVDKYSNHKYAYWAKLNNLRIL